LDNRANFFLAKMTAAFANGGAYRLMEVSRGEVASEAITRSDEFVADKCR
jgi:hypothetical protein